MATRVTEQRIGDYIEVYGGTRFYPLDPREDEIHIEDIAHALALTCRFSGHTRTFYSVAEHSVRVSQICPPEHALWGLLHDAAEAYLNDLPRPIKRDSGFWLYRDIENAIQVKVCQKFGLTWPMPFLVKRADNIILATEARDLMAIGALERWPSIGEEPLAETIRPWEWHLAHKKFRDRFEELT